MNFSFTPHTSGPTDGLVDNLEIVATNDTERMQLKKMIDLLRDGKEVRFKLSGKMPEIKPS